MVPGPRMQRPDEYEWCFFKCCWRRFIQLLDVVRGLLCVSCFCEFHSAPGLETRPYVSTPVGGFWRASCMHRCIPWVYACWSGLLSAAAPAIIYLCAASSALYRLHVCCWSAKAPVADCRTRCMLSCTGLSSNSMVPLLMSRPLGSDGGAGCRAGGSLVASTSLMLLWVDVWDCAAGPSDCVSDVLVESISCCSSCAWSSRDCTTSMVSPVTFCCCCGSPASSQRCIGGSALML